MTQSGNERNHKRQQFVSSKGSRDKRTVFLMALLVVALAGVGYLLFGHQSGTAAAGRYSGGDVSIPIAQIGTEAKFFEYKSASDKIVKFFVLRSSDGVYRAAADACEVCYRSKMGYKQEGDDMVCRKCGRHFHSKDVNVVTGGCNPSGIPVKVQGDNLSIAAADLNAQAALF